MNAPAWLRRLLLSILLALLGAAGGWASRAHRWSDAPAPPVLPPDVKAKPGRLTLIATEAAHRVCWHACRGPEAPDLLPLNDGRQLVFVAARPGEYELIAWSAAGDTATDAALCRVRVEAEVPLPAPDAFVQKLRAAWSVETDAQKLTRRDLLAGLYRSAADAASRPPGPRTIGELFTSLRQASQALMPDAALPFVRSAIAEELRRLLPTAPEAALDSALREQAAAAFRRIADALSSLPAEK